MVRGRRKRTLVTVGIVVAVLFLFYLQWHEAPRIEIAPSVASELQRVPPKTLYLGPTFEGLPLRTVNPFLYSDCAPDKPKLVVCRWVRVDDGRVTASNPDRARRALKALRPVGDD
jgi:hypothetical protein